MLEQAKFTISQIGNAPERNYKKTTVYDLTFGHKDSSLAVLEKISRAHLRPLTLPNG